MLPHCTPLRRKWSVALVALVALGCSRSAPGPAGPEGAAAGQPPVAAEKAVPLAPAPPSREPAVAVGRNGAVSSAETAASNVGIEIMKQGGNAVDAAVAVGFALGVTHPTAGNIGGGGFMVVRLPSGEVTAIDYREVAPQAASRDMYLDAKGDVGDKGRVGALAAGIPGVVAGLAHAHRKFGKLPWARVIEPAIALAKQGHVLDGFHAKDMEWAVSGVAKYSESAGTRSAPLSAALKATAATFTKPDGSPYHEGDTWIQSDLAATLELIAKSGPEAFYTGPFAERMASNVRELGGIWTTQDLAAYRAIERQPVIFPYRGHEVITMPPPSAGGVVLRQILAASEALSLDRLDWDSVQRIHYYVEALRRTYADRNQLVGDPAFVNVPMQQLLDIHYIGERMATIDPAHATPSSEVGAGVQLKEQDKFRREFLGNLAHELKTPVFSIQGYVLTLLEGGLEDDKVNRIFLERAAKAIDRMTHILEDLDELTKLEVNELKLEIRPFDIRDLAREVIESFEMKAQEKGISVRFSKEYSTALMVKADRGKIAQVFTNLIGNSITYGNDGGETLVRFYEVDDIVTVEISDNGPGIDLKHIPRLFERFYRVEKSRNRNEGGSGLGLAIVKHILDSHHQTISVRSTVGIGSTFTFSLDRYKGGPNTLVSSRGIQIK